MTSINSVKNPFELWLNGQLTQNERPVMVDAILVACKISLPTFYRRVKDPSLFSPAEMEKIAQLAGKPVTELFA